MPPKMTEEDRALLTEEELAGVEDETLVDEGEADETDDDAAAQAAADEAAKAKKPDGDGGDAGKGDADEAAKKAAADAAAAAAADADGAKAKEAEDAPKPAPAPRNALPDWKAPEDAEQKLKDIEKQIDDIAAKFDDGELTSVEYRQQTRELDNQRRELDRQILKAQMAQETAASALEAAKDNWYDTCAKFIAEHPEYGEGKVLNGALNQAVIALQFQQADNQFDPSILTRADAQIRAELGMAPRGAQQPPKKDVKEREIPPSLAHVPAADTDDIDGGSEFAAIDGLEGEAYEAALMRMSDEARERYLSR